MAYTVMLNTQNFDVDVQNVSHSKQNPRVGKCMSLGSAR